MTLEEIYVRGHEIEKMEPARAHYAEDAMLYAFIEEIAGAESQFKERAAALSRFVSRDTNRWYE